MPLLGWSRLSDGLGRADVETPTSQWQPPAPAANTLVSTEGDLSILGRPVVIDTNVADAATSAKSILFGDFSAYRGPAPVTLSTSFWRPYTGARGRARDALSTQTAAVPSTQIAEPHEQRGRIWRSSCVIGRPAYVQPSPGHRLRPASRWMSAQVVVPPRTGRWRRGSQRQLRRGSPCSRWPRIFSEAETNRGRHHLGGLPHPTTSGPEKRFEHSPESRGSFIVVHDTMHRGRVHGYRKGTHCRSSSVDVESHSDSFLACGLTEAELSSGRGSQTRPVQCPLDVGSED